MYSEGPRGSLEAMGTWMGHPGPEEPALLGTAMMESHLSGWGWRWGRCHPRPHRTLPHEHPLQQLLVALRVAGPVLLDIFVHAVPQSARAVFGVYTGHLHDIQLSLSKSGVGNAWGLYRDMHADGTCVPR